MSKKYTIIPHNERSGRDYTPVSGTIDELLEYHSYTLQKGKSWEHEKGNSKINMKPRTGPNLVKQLNAAENNAAANGYSMIQYRLG